MAPDIATGSVWKIGEREWVEVAEVHGQQITGKLRTVPAIERDWSGSPADLQRGQPTARRRVSASCEHWDHDRGIRVLGEHLIQYESQTGEQEITHPPAVHSIVVSATLYAVSDAEAAERMVAALEQASAGPVTDVQPVGL